MNLKQFRIKFIESILSILFLYDNGKWYKRSSFDRKGISSMYARHDG